MPKEKRDNGELLLPLDQADAVGATLGKMLYPGTQEEESELAAAVARRYSGDAVRSFLRHGGELQPGAMFEALINPIDPFEDEMRLRAGQATGQLTKLLIALFNSDPKLASWNNAARIVKKATGDERGTGRSVLMEHKQHYLPVAHLWAAWVLRDGKFAADEMSGYSLATDFQRFICEAERIRLWGQNFTPGRDKAKPLFDVPMWKAPVAWLEPQPLPQWPGESWLPPVTALDTQLALLRRAGRPKTKKHS